MAVKFFNPTPGANTVEPSALKWKGVVRRSVAANLTFIFAVIPVSGVESGLSVDAALVEQAMQSSVVCISAHRFVDDLCVGKFGAYSFQ